MNGIFVNCGLLLLCMFGVANPVLASPMSITKIVESNEFIADGWFGDACLDRGNVYFSCRSSSYSGIYKWDQHEITKIVDIYDLVPGKQYGFELITDFSVHNDSIAFQGYWPGAGFSVYRAGIYHWSDHILAAVATSYHQAPGSTQNFLAVSDPHVGEGGIAFRGYLGPSFYSGTAGLYIQKDEMLNLLYSEGMQMPEGNNFRGLHFGYTPFRGCGDVVFRAYSGGMDKEIGIYAGSGGPLSTIANLNTPVPGGKNTFENFSPNFSVDESGDVAFIGCSSGKYILCKYLQNEIYLIPDASMYQPLYTKSRGEIMLDSGSVVYYMENQEGGTTIETDILGFPETLISEGDMLFGKLITGLHLSKQPICGLQVVFKAVFSDDTSGVFLATYERNSSNNPPIVNAGNDITIQLPVDNAFLTGSYSDDHLPAAGNKVVCWIGDPEVVTFDSPDSTNTTARFTTPGTYILQFSGTDGEKSAHDQVTVTVLEYEKAPLGTPLEWLEEYGMTGPVDQVELSDVDGDGVPAWREFIDGTNPTNKLSCLEISAEIQQDEIIIKFPSITVADTLYEGKERFYKLYSSHDLLDWTPKREVFPATGEILSITNFMYPTSGFFKVEALLE